MENSNKTVQKRHKKNNNNYVFKKKPSPKVSCQENDIYITNKTNFKAQLKRCEDLLNSGLKDIYIHCLGSAITRGINLALILVDNSNSALSYAVNTSTIPLIDELHPLCNDEDILVSRRNNSAIHIRISRNKLVLWLGLTEFEILVNLCGLLIFTIMLAVRISGTFYKSMDWFTLFCPLFSIDIMNAYFCIIVGIRMYLDSDNKRRALHRFMWSTYFLVLVAIFKYLLCLKLSGQTGLEYSEVFSPIFVLLQLVAVRACQLPNSV